MAPLTFGNILAVLDRTDDGGAAGRVDSDLVGFMALRTTGYQPTVASIRRPSGVPHRGLTEVDPRSLGPFGDQHDLRLRLTLHQPGVNIAVSCDDDGTPNGILLSDVDSYAEVPYTPEASGRWSVTQLGRHRLWDTVETALACYRQQGAPDRTRIGITVEPDGEQRLWLDDPAGPYSWPMPQ